MKLAWFMLIVLGLVPVGWIIGDRLVGMGDMSFWPKELPTYVAGIVVGVCVGLYVSNR